MSTNPVSKAAGATTPRSRRSRVRRSAALAVSALGLTLLLAADTAGAAHPSSVVAGAQTGISLCGDQALAPPINRSYLPKEHDQGYQERVDRFAENQKARTDLWNSTYLGKDTGDLSRIIDEAAPPGVASTPTSVSRHLLTPHAEPADKLAAAIQITSVNLFQRAGEARYSEPGTPENLKARKQVIEAGAAAVRYNIAAQVNAYDRASRYAGRVVEGAPLDAAQRCRMLKTLLLQQEPGLSPESATRRANELFEVIRGTQPYVRGGTETTWGLIEAMGKAATDWTVSPRDLGLSPETDVIAAHVALAEDAATLGFRALAAPA